MSCLTDVMEPPCRTFLAGSRTRSPPIEPRGPRRREVEMHVRVLEIEEFDATPAEAVSTAEVVAVFMPGWAEVRRTQDRCSHTRICAPRDAIDRPGGRHDASDGQRVGWPVQSGRTVRGRSNTARIRLPPRKPPSIIPPWHRGRRPCRAAQSRKGANQRYHR
jgi:hypothetical protein